MLYFEPARLCSSPEKKMAIFQGFIFGWTGISS